MRALFSSSPIPGQVQVMLGLAEVLMARGNEVVFFAPDEAATRVEAAGVRAMRGGIGIQECRRRYLKETGRERAAEIAGDPVPEADAALLTSISSAAMAKDLLPFAQRWQPQVIVGSLQEWASEAAAASVGATYVVHGLSLPKTAKSGSALDEARRGMYLRLGTPPRPAPERLGDVYLDIWPTSLRGESERWLYPVSWPMRPDRILPGPGVSERPAVLDGMSNPGCVYVAREPGEPSSGDYFDAVLDGLADEDVNVVVATGKGVDEVPRYNLPANVRTVRFAPEAELLPYCELVICRGSTAAVLGSLLHGVPVLVIPKGAEGAETAAAVSGAGAGAAITMDALTPAALGTLRAEISANPAYRRAAIEIGREISAMPSAVSVAKRLESIL